MYNVYYIDEEIIGHDAKKKPIKRYFNVVSGTFSTLEEAKEHLQKLFKETDHPSYIHEPLNSVSFRVLDKSKVIGSGFIGLAYVKNMG